MSYRRRRLLLYENRACAGGVLMTGRHQGRPTQHQPAENRTATVQQSTIIRRLASSTRRSAAASGCEHAPLPGVCKFCRQTSFYWATTELVAHIMSTNALLFSAIRRLIVCLKRGLYVLAGGQRANLISEQTPEAKRWHKHTYADSKKITFFSLPVA